MDLLEFLAIVEAVKADPLAVLAQIVERRWGSAVWNGIAIEHCRTPAAERIYPIRTPLGIWGGVGNDEAQHINWKS